MALAAIVVPIKTKINYSTVVAIDSVPKSNLGGYQALSQEELKELKKRMEDFAEGRTRCVDLGMRSDHPEKMRA